MAYTVATLITRAWYLSGVVSRDLETVSGDQLNDGLCMLNALLSFKTAQNRLIPYYTIYEMTSIAGQEKYYIPNLIQLDCATFFIGDVRYSMYRQERRMYFGTPRVNPIEALPCNWHLERTLGGANFYMYFEPNANLPVELTGKFSLADVTLNQDLELTMDQFYIEYLRYGLAEYMCEEYNIQMQPGPTQKLLQYEKMITDISPLDLQMQKISSLQEQSGLNYGQANLGRGWVSP